MHAQKIRRGVELLIFDFDGTLVDSKYDIATSVNLTLKDLGLPPRSHEEIFSFVGDGVKHLLRLSVGEDNPSLYEEALVIFRQHYLAHCLDTTQIYPGIHEVFEHYGPMVKAIATNKSLEYTLRIVEGLKIREDFAAIECPEDISDLKPDPGMLLRILDTLQLHADQAIFVGDSTNDIRAAKAAGITSCAVGYGYGNRKKVAALEPDFFCATPLELKTLFAGHHPIGRIPSLL